MNDYVNRQAAINSIKETSIYVTLDYGIGAFPVISTETALNQLVDLPSADVRENVHGEWEQVVSGCAILMRCNQCKNAISENDFFEICRKVNHGSKLLDFCPNCGADMR